MRKVSPEVDHVEALNKFPSSAGKASEWEKKGCQKREEASNVRQWHTFAWTGRNIGEYIGCWACCWKGVEGCWEIPFLTDREGVGGGVIVESFVGQYDVGPLIKTKVKDNVMRHSTQLTPESFFSQRSKCFHTIVLLLKIHSFPPGYQSIDSLSLSLSFSKICLRYITWKSTCSNRTTNE